MNKELREKIKENSELIYCCLDNECLDCSVSADCSNYEKAHAYMLGAESMYAELSPLVEWVSVKDGMPENTDKILAKGFIIGYGFYEKSVEFANCYDGDFHSKLDKVTHWKKIDL